MSKKIVKCIIWLLIIIAASTIGACLAALTFPKLGIEGRMPYTILGSCIGVIFSRFIASKKER